MILLFGYYHFFRVFIGASSLKAVQQNKYQKNIKKSMSSKYMVYAGIAIGMAAMPRVIVYVTSSQQNYVVGDAVLVPAAEQGALSSP